MGVEGSHKKMEGGIDYLLTPCLSSSMGNERDPTFDGWGIMKKEGSTVLCGWKVATEYSPECLKNHVKCTVIKEAGEEPLVWFSPLSHLSLLWGSSCGSFAVW